MTTSFWDKSTPLPALSGIGRKKRGNPRDKTRAILNILLTSPCVRILRKQTLFFKVGGRVPMPPVCSSQSRERKHDLWCRGNRLLYTRDGLVDISLVTENIQKKVICLLISVFTLNSEIFVYWNVTFLCNFATEVNVDLVLVYSYLFFTHSNITPGEGSQSLDFFTKHCLYCYRLTINNFGTCKKIREYNLSCMIYVFDTYV